MSDKPHIADAEAGFQVVNVTPDFCCVDGQVVAFEIHRELPPERRGYARQVRARGVPVLMVDSVVAGVMGNMGKGVLSTVSQGDGNVRILEGDETVRAEGSSVARHGDLCFMNGKVG